VKRSHMCNNRNAIAFLLARRGSSASEVNVRYLPLATLSRRLYPYCHSNCAMYCALRQVEAIVYG